MVSEVKKNIESAAKKYDMFETIIIVVQSFGEGVRKLREDS